MVVAGGGVNQLREQVNDPLRRGVKPAFCLRCKSHAVSPFSVSSVVSVDGPNRQGSGVAEAAVPSRPGGRHVVLDGHRLEDHLDAARAAVVGLPGVDVPVRLFHLREPLVAVGAGEEQRLFRWHGFSSPFLCLAPRQAAIAMSLWPVCTPTTSPTPTLRW